MKNKKISVFLYWCSIIFLTLLIGYLSLLVLRQPRLISEWNKPIEFYAIGFSKEQPFLLTLADESRVFRKNFASHDQKEKYQKQYEMSHSDIKLLWNEDISKYNYYIKEEDLVKILNDLNFSLSSQGIKVHAKLLNNNPKELSQKIFLKVEQGESSYSCIYEVESKVISPVAYGDFIKADGANAFLIAFVVFLFLAIISRKLLKNL